MSNSVMMEKDGAQTLVNNNESVQIMQGLGWALVELMDAPADEAKPRGKPGPKPKVKPDGEE